MQQRSGSRSCAKSTVAPEGTSETGRRDVGMFQQDLSGPGNGFINVFTTDGVRIPCTSICK